MRILIVGNGGREHTLLWKLRRDAPGAAFYATRPNGGMAPHCAAVDIAPTDVVALAGWAAANRIDLAVVGPETPLAAGLADRMKRSGVPVFGPSAGAARIESSKAFAKDLMAGAGVPTAAYEVHTDADRAAAFIESVGAPVVVKASGLAAGKGAIVCGTVEEAVTAARDMLSGSFGEAGRKVVIEEYMEGEELSVFCLADGEEFVPLLSSQDHKRIGEGDTGPNTGGMGAYAPVGFVTDALIEEVGDRVVAPVLTALAEGGNRFSGLLYAGLMVTGEGPKVVEFNCRFGDPETQAVLPLLASSLLEPMMAVAEGSGLADHAPVFADAAAVTTVLAASGYPGSYRKGAPIDIPPLPQGAEVFHAGTALRSGHLVASGGRVLAVTALDRDFERARTVSRAVAQAITFEGKYYRRDIGWREAERRS
ncbi:MAG: phosphoribosylamine--glycine ligase [Gemmatimonadetes bacterium]|nr:phosphoribosylamine--glycine ligase [Gemmatimonadota bacterium]MYE18194.1 phosphoribosylamine--glycine ligase [Gemmatimonadota bacterium]